MQKYMYMQTLVLYSSTEYPHWAKERTMLCNFYYYIHIFILSNEYLTRLLGTREN